MKKLRLILLMAVAAIAACNFTACKDDGEGSGSIVGTWKWQDSDGSYETYTFNADGSYTNVCYETDKGPNSYPVTDRGTYTYDGKTLTVNSQTYGWTATDTVTVSGNRLIFDYGDGETSTYIRQ